jgi:penicillin-binding protein 2
LNEKTIQGKVKMFAFIILLMVCALIGRLAFLQLFRGEELAALADGNRFRLIPITAPRGSMYDRNGVLMVTSRPAYTVSVVLLDLQNTEQVAQELGQILDMEPSAIMSEIDKRRLQGRLYEPIRIKVDINEETHTRLEERRADLPGVLIEVETVREYLFGDMAAHALGYVGASDTSNQIEGKTGLEKVYNSALAGVDGGKQIEVNARGTHAVVIGQEDPVPGSDLVLTIDSKLQEVALRALDESMRAVRTQSRSPYRNAHQGAVVAMDPRNGEILAYVSLPTYDPNQFVRGISQAEWERLNDPVMRPLINRVSGATYPPGSVFKMVTASAALQERVVSPSERVHCSGAFRIYNVIARCWVRSGHGGSNITRALAVSCNVYFYEMGTRLGVDRIAKYASMYGLGQPTGIDHDVDRAGTLPTIAWKSERLNQPWWPGETIYAAIGQGYHAFTPLQLACYVSAIANDGVRYTPYLVKDIIGPDGSPSQRFSPLTAEPKIAEVVAVDQNNLRLVREGMRGAAQAGGTAGWIFRNFPIPVGAKTGTAQNSTGDNHGVFVAFAPYDNPEIVVAVLVEQGGSGSGTGAPVARAIFEEYFRLKEHAASDGSVIPDQSVPSGVE